MKVSMPQSSEDYAIMGQSRVNQLGGHYINGKPLPQSVRAAIVEMHNQGVNRRLRISHGAVSKILNRFQETGSVAPGQIGGNQRHRKTVQSVEKHILQLKEACPDSNALEIQQRLIEMGLCTKNNVPTVNSITRHLRSRGLHSTNSSLSPKQGQKLPHSIENILGKPMTSTSVNSEVRCTSTESLPSTASLNSGRSRTNFTQEQVDVLEKAYNLNPYPNTEEKDDISKKTGLTQEKVGVWFSNRRARLRKSMTSTVPETPSFKPNPLLLQQLLNLNGFNSSVSFPTPFPAFFPNPTVFPMQNPFLYNKSVFLQ